MISHITDVRVRYADTDQMKFVYYGKFFEYFEQGRSDLLRAIGLPYPQIEAMGVLLPVVEAGAKYRRSARYDDLLHVQTMMLEMPMARIRLEYLVFRDHEKEPIAEGFTVHSFLNAASGRPTRAPLHFIEMLHNAVRHPSEKG
ncbi:MAG: thioesterase family protein [Ignavibacteriales bacterium]|nr:thioesterase family protein [Ignavibacteriales bacterium]